MQVAFKGLCRGNGKIFIKVEIEQLQSDSKIKLTCTAKDGFILPSRIYQLDKNETTTSYVVVLPNMPVKEELTFTEVDSNENLIGEPVKKSVSSFIAKWESRINYKLHKGLTKQIRDFDERAQYDRIHMEFWEIIPLENDQFRVRLQLEIPYNSDADIELQCFDESLKLVDSEFIFLGEDYRSVSWKNTVSFRVLRYSIVLNNKNKHYLFTARNKNDQKLSGFAVLKPANCKRRIKEWVGDHIPIIDIPYEEWFDMHRANQADINMQVNTHLDMEPLFSFIVPLYKTPIKLFDEMVRSVIEQSYAKWELLLVNASPEDSALSSRIAANAETDPRIKEIKLESNMGISLNTRAGIEAASGDYICFLDHDDTIEPDMLFEYAIAINKNPKIDLLYCDEDKLMPNGSYDGPFFKPDFSIDLLRNVNYICHMLCVRKSLINSLELYTQEVDGAQDHDLTLKVAEISTNIHHVPRILYHWRICEGSVAAGADAKPYAIQAGVNAVQSHLDRLGIRAKVTPNKIPFSYDIEYLVDDINPLISIIIPSKDECETLARCIDSIIEKTTYNNYEIVVVENNSEQSETFKYYETISAKYDYVRVERWAHEFNFSKIVNFGAQKAQGDYLVLLNNDTEIITNNWLEQMLGVCRRDDVGIVGVRLWYPDDTIQHAGIVMVQTGPIHIYHELPKGNSGYSGLTLQTQDLSAVTAACVMVKKEIFDQVGGFDEEFAIAFNDVDFCLRVRELEKLIVYLPSVELYHYESLSRGYENTPEKQIRFNKEAALLRLRWTKYYILGDPYFRPTLSLG
ncbi:glycosyltransferase family 2 protein [Adlercreutzia sp. ZJ304]|uniref:glycosyltransferase family 2 protein n=1 Tax=Adlercreutzia sp. ZJ304 TaxID=2709791 RepID=UPI0013EBFA69|nr:glycosyltransferase family 2 protein [Adlercreutzia sp. ZJ304]